MLPFLARLLLEVLQICREPCPLPLGFFGRQLLLPFPVVAINLFGTLPEASFPVLERGDVARLRSLPLCLAGLALLVEDGLLRLPFLILVLDCLGFLLLFEVEDLLCSELELFLVAVHLLLLFFVVDLLG